MQRAFNRESDLERRVCQEAKALGMLVYKFTSPGHRAVPDRMFITRAGRVGFIEFKARGRYPTRLQEVEIQRLKAQNVEVIWSSDLDECIGFLNVLNER